MCWPTLNRYVSRHHLWDTQFNVWVATFNISSAMLSTYCESYHDLSMLHIQTRSNNKPKSFISKIAINKHVHVSSNKEDWLWWLLLQLWMIHDFLIPKIPAGSPSTRKFGTSSDFFVLLTTFPSSRFRTSRFLPPVAGVGIIRCIPDVV